MAEVTLEHVCKSFDGKGGRVDAVNDVSLAVADRELVVLVGPSGCGKTTILRLIAGLETLTKGTIRIAGTVVNDVTPKDRDVAMVFQNYALYPHMTVRKNLGFGLKMRRVPKAEIRRIVERVAGLLGIEPLLNRKPAALSGGEQQRVALGRAIVRKPRVFLFDEPLSNLDARLRVQTRTEIKSLHRDLRATIVYVTHDQEEAMTLGDRIVVLNRGAVQQCGTPLDVYDKPANRFVAGFFGNPPMTFLEGNLENSKDALAFVSATGRLPLPMAFADALRNHAATGLVVGIRPEHVLLVREGETGSVDASGIGGTRSGDRRAAGEAAPASAANSGAVHLADMVIHLVERLGDATNVYLAGPDGTPVVARVGPTADFAPSQTVKVFVNAARLHLFEGGTFGGRLNPTGN